MSHTSEPNQPEREQGHLAGPGSAGGADYPGGFNWAGYASAPPPPPRRKHKRGLVVTAASAVAWGPAAGGLIGSSHGLTATPATAVSKTVLSSSEIAKTVDPALVDVVSTDGDSGEVAA